MLCSCGNKKSENAEGSSLIKTAFLENVKTAKSVVSNQEQELTLTGKVKYDLDKIINYVPLISGVIDRTYFSLGDKVQKGQPLLDIRSTELSALQSEKISLEVEEKVAERELRAVQSMFDDNMISEKELLEAKGKLKQTQAAINKIKSDMNVYGIDKGNGIFSIQSPMSGYIVSKNASSGSTLSADGDPVFTVADLSTVWIIANVYAGNLLFVREGMDAEISTLSYPDETFAGKIDAISQVFDPEEKVLKARIVMKNNDLKFKPEMSVVVKLKNEKPLRFVSVSSDALIFDENRYFVVVEENPGQFKIREVTVQEYHNKVTYIATGLLEDEKVVIANQLLIYQAIKEG